MKKSSNEFAARIIAALEDEIRASRRIIADDRYSVDALYEKEHLKVCEAKLREMYEKTTPKVCRWCGWEECDGQKCLGL